MRHRILTFITASGIALASGLLVTTMLTGCASTKFTPNQAISTERLPRPNQIWIYDFTFDPAEVPADSALTNAEAPATPPTAEEIALGHALGAGIASNLVSEIQTMGMPAAEVTAGTKPKMTDNDIVVRGYLVSVDQGSRAKRMTIGFGAGGSELTTLLEAYQMTPTGLRKLGSATVDAGGGKGPGGAVGAAMWVVTGSPVGLVVGGGVKIYGEASGKATIEGRAKATAKEIGERIKVKFQQQGWIP